MTAPRWNRTPRRLSLKRLLLWVAGRFASAWISWEYNARRSDDARDAPVAERARDLSWVAPILDGELCHAILLRPRGHPRRFGPAVDLEGPAMAGTRTCEGRSVLVPSGGAREGAWRGEKGAPRRRVPRRASPERLDTQYCPCCGSVCGPTRPRAVPRRRASQHLLARDEGLAALAEARQALEGARVQRRGQHARDGQLGRHSSERPCGRTRESLGPPPPSPSRFELGVDAARNRSTCSLGGRPT